MMAMQPQQQPQRRGGVPGVPPDFKAFMLSATRGLNTKDSRSSIEDEETSWQENLIRIGFGKLRTIYDRGTTLYTATGGNTIISAFSFNIGATFYHAVFLSDGTAVQVRISDGAVTTISAVANTFWQIGRQRPACSQWGTQYLLILTVDGYWIWDGALLFGPGTLAPFVAITKAGAGMTTPPELLIIHPNNSLVSGATAVAEITNGNLTKVTITNPGSGIVPGEIIRMIVLGIAHGGQDGAYASANLTAQKVTSISVNGAGTGYLVAPNVTIVGGGGSGATATATVGAGNVTGITVINQGDGYTSQPTVIITAAAGDNIELAEVSMLLPPVSMPFGIAGTAIETFLSRVWLTNEDTIQFSAPASFQDFATSSGGGAVQSTDSFLKVRFPAIKQANGYLYPFGDSSIQVISNVQSFGSPITTTFNNANTDPQIGTPWRDSVAAYGRALMFCNETGIYGLFGGTAQKMSDKLDGIFLAIPNRSASGTAEPSACLATLFEIRVYCCLIPIFDPFAGTTRNALMVWDGSTWFIASQTIDLDFVWTQMQESKPRAWGTDGATIFPLFEQPSDALAKILQSKLWPGDGFIISKQAIGLYTQTEDNSGLGEEFDVTVDTETAQKALTVAASNTFTWINNGGQTFTWINNLSQTFTWGTTGVVITSQAIESLYGYLMGFTLDSVSEDFTIIAIAIGYRPYSSIATSAVQGG